jgi:hypothetical protein
MQNGHQPGLHIADARAPCPTVEDGKRALQSGSHRGNWLPAFENRPPEVLFLRRVYINGLEGFWSWAKERLMKHHGVSKHRFPQYLKELEFRYNHRTEGLFDMIANYLCDLVPKQD